ncbi:MAG TPA: HAD family hydrolase [Woeseiaceae bacterium]|nr:HAD family hydrolase [Woeseiaceae bacterium]
MPPLVIFDMDGVLVDSEPMHMRLEREMFERLSLPISEAEHQAFVGMSPAGMWGTIKARFDLPHAVDDLVEMDTDVKAREIGATPLEPIDGVEELIADLEDAGCELAVASSSQKRLIEAVTEGLGLRQRFSHLVSAEEVRRGKPHPDVFIRAAELCGRKPADCLVIEDSANGVRAALAAGMKCVGFVNESAGRQDLSGADLVVRNFGDAARKEIVALARSLSFLRD